MKSFTITPVPEEIREDVQHLIDGKTKPIGALGQLEVTARKIGLILGTTRPELRKPAIIVFAGDHGIAESGEVNPYPQEVTAQMVLNFLSGGAAINVFCHQHQLNLHVVDAGVNYDFQSCAGLRHAKIGFGTQNYLLEPAMTWSQCSDAIAAGAESVRDLANDGCNIIGFGEMGIGNTSSASLLMSRLMDRDIAKCVGRGTGLDAEGVTRKIRVLQSVLDRHPDVRTPEDVLATFGGFEIAMIVGAFLSAAEQGMIIMVDGFIVTAALLVAQRMNPAVTEYCVFMHASEEAGHKAMLDAFHAQPLLDLGMRLGEGTGIAVGYPLLVSAVSFLNRMASFEDADVSGRR